MSSIWVNGEEKTIHNDDFKTVWDVLMAAQQELWDETQAIEQVILDGQPVEQLTTDFLADMAWCDQKVEVTLSEARPMPSEEETLEQAIAYADALKQGLAKLAETIRNTEGPKSLLMLRDALDGMANLFDLVQYFASTTEISEELKEKTQDLSKTISEQVNELNQAQGDEDNILMADILEYEFEPLLESLAHLFQEYKESLS